MNNDATSARKLMHSILLSKGRMEALTDGIFAIAMTLLVLELKVPELPKSIGVHELLSKLGEQGPAFFSFLVSFLYCGLLWVMHHLAMHFIRHLQIVLVWLNLLFLMSISLMPFSCALLGHFLHNPAAREIYFGNQFIAASLLALKWMVAKKRQLINDEDINAGKIMGQRLMFFPIAMGAAMGATLFHAAAGFWAIVAVLLVMRLWQRKSFKNKIAGTT